MATAAQSMLMNAASLERPLLGGSRVHGTDIGKMVELRAPLSARTQSSFLQGHAAGWSQRMEARKGSVLRAAARSPIVCNVSVQAQKSITFHIGETSVTSPFSAESARGLNAAITKLLQTFKEKEKATRPQRWESMEFIERGDLSSGGAYLEFFCNPNAYSNAFLAKVLITVSDDRLKFTSEGQLSALKADIDGYLDSVKN